MFLPRFLPLFSLPHFRPLSLLLNLVDLCNGTFKNLELQLLLSPDRIRIRFEETSLRIVINCLNVPSILLGQYIKFLMPKCFKGETEQAQSIAGNS